MAATATPVDGADDKVAGVADGGALGKGRNVRVGNADRVLEFVGEAAEAGAEHQSDARAERGARENEFRGFLRVREFPESDRVKPD